MKNRSMIFFILLIAMMITPGVCLSGQQHSLGMDLIRLVDEAQYDGMANLFYQVSIDERSAVRGGFARGDDATLFDVAYKYYLNGYFDGPFAGAGVVTGHFDGDTEFGVTGFAGYEMGLSQYLVLSGAVEVTAGSMDNPATGHRDLIFRPVLSLICAF